VYIKKVNIDAGCAMGIHQHTFTHKSVLARGFGFLTLNGERLGVDAGTVLTVPLGANHLFEAVTNCVWLCIHSTDEQELDKITGDITPEEKPQ
jgi:quercetin dioxygenase-like cupin family protein